MARIELETGRSEVLRVEHFISFELKGSPGSGYQFPCTAEGRLLWKQMSRQAADNYVRVTTIDSNRFEWKGIVSYEDKITCYPLGRCYCGELVELSGFTNTCEVCGRDYGMDGTVLNPRSMWLEVTDRDTVQDILNVDRN